MLTNYLITYDNKTILYNVIDISYVEKLNLYNKIISLVYYILSEHFE